MKISAQIRNSQGHHETILKTNDNVHSLTIQPKAKGFGSRTNGGELLFLALATCYCNDIYREAEKMGIQVTNVEVIVEGDFGSDGEPAKNVTYSAKVNANASIKEIDELMRNTDKVAEIHNTLRIGIPVTLKAIEAQIS
jgi:organic hydroperoxide reductase OsmC/OhrA